MRIDSETIVTSSGIIRNRSKPRVGIIGASALYAELYDDCITSGIDLTWEDFEIVWLIVTLRGKSYTVQGFFGLILAGILCYGLGSLVLAILKR